jgi:cyclase
MDKRIIARLDIKGPNVIKGIQMEGLRKIGEPSSLSREYYKQGADELIYIDTVATLYGRKNLEQIVRTTADEIFIPLTVGGGIRSLDDARLMMLAGADKIAVNSGAVREPSLISDIARVFGSQCVVLYIEAKQKSAKQWEAFIDNGREPTGLDVVEWAKIASTLGIGEILLTSVDKDGTGKSLDISLLQEVSSCVNVPVIASGGVGKLTDISDAFTESKVDGVAIASALHYKKFSISDIKNHCLSVGLQVRDNQ